MRALQIQVGRQYLKLLVFHKMEDITINSYTQVLLAAIGTALVSAIGALWIILWKVIAEKEALHDKHQERLAAMVDRYHNFATTIERAIKG